MARSTDLPGPVTTRQWPPVAPREDRAAQWRKFTDATPDEIAALDPLLGAEYNALRRLVAAWRAGRAAPVHLVQVGGIDELYGFADPDDAQAYAAARRRGDAVTGTLTVHDSTTAAALIAEARGDDTDGPQA